VVALANKVMNIQVPKTLLFQLCSCHLFSTMYCNWIDGWIYESIAVDEDRQQSGCKYICLGGYVDR
jgi:hypothetical protein